MEIMSSLRKSIIFSLFGIGVVGLSGCEPFTSIRGNIPDPHLVEQIQPGVYTQDQVIELLGPPTAKDPFNPGIWYYLGEKTERIAFFSPAILEKKGAVVVFNKQGIVEGVELLETPHDFELNPHKRKTRTFGHDPSLFKQLFGNFGRFSRQKADSK